MFFYVFIFVTRFFQSERREKHEKENAATLADEVDRVKMEVEQEKAELQVNLNISRGAKFNFEKKKPVKLFSCEKQKCVLQRKKLNDDPFGLHVKTCTLYFIETIDLTHPSP